MTLKISHRACSRVLPLQLELLEDVQVERGESRAAAGVAAAGPERSRRGIGKRLRRIGDRGACRGGVREQVVEVLVVNRIGEAVGANHVDCTCPDCRSCPAQGERTARQRAEHGADLQRTATDDGARDA